MTNRSLFLRYAFSLALSTIVALKLTGQSTASGIGPAGHNVLGFPAINYCGWDAATPIPFNLEHRGNQNINFRTNYGLATPGLGNRMIISNGNFGNNAGQIAMGNNLPDAFVPAARLHLHQDGGNVFMRYTTAATGTTTNDGLIVGISNAGAGIIANYEDDQPIAFYTENMPPFVSYERMRINANNRNGFIAIGNASAFLANAQLHINTINVPGGGLGAAAYGNLFRTDANDALRCQWQLVTGPNMGTLSEKFVLFTSPTTATQAANNARNQVTLQSSQGDLILSALGYNLTAAAPAAKEVMRVTRTQIAHPFPGSPFDEGRVSISRLVPTPANPVAGPVVVPLAMLHIGDQTTVNPPYGNPNGIAGWRPWMDVGTYYSLGSDNMYVGLKAVAADMTQAVVSWGNNPSSSALGGDRLLFLFTAAQNPANGTAQGPNGLEIGRMWTDGTISRTGFGGDATNLYSTGTQDPGNTLEVNSFGATNVAGGSSGLRFTNLNAASPSTPNVAAGNVLSVDANGDVILVPGGGGLGFGGACNFAAPPPGMTSSFQIPMNNQNFIWSGQGSTGNSVGIGINSCTPFAKLHVLQNSGAVPPVASPGSIGILSVNSDIDGVALMALSNGTATGTLTKVAGWFQATPAAGADQVAIFVPAGGGFVEIGYAYPHVTTARLDVAGTVASFGVALTSDQSLKQNVNTITNGMDVICNLRPVTFEWIQPLDSAMGGTHSGFIAQQVDTVIPHVVHTGSDSLKSVAYEEIIPYLVKALQEEHARNSALAQTLDSLVNAVGNCCGSTARTGNNVHQQDVALSNSASIVLNQNVPNPFAEQTSIAFQLPQTVARAQMLFYDAQGKLIKAVDLNERGAGQLNVFADDLSNGIYSYALVADGQVVDTKHMVKVK